MDWHNLPADVETWAAGWPDGPAAVPHLRAAQRAFYGLAAGGTADSVAAAASVARACIRLRTASGPGWSLEGWRDLTDWNRTEELWSSAVRLRMRLRLEHVPIRGVFRADVVEEGWWSPATESPLPELAAAGAVREEMRRRMRG